MLKSIGAFVFVRCRVGGWAAALEGGRPLLGGSVMGGSTVTVYKNTTITMTLQD